MVATAPASAPPSLPLQCVILAGGLGTRMKPLTDTIPKALLPVGGRPFAHHQLELLAGQGVTDVVYSVGHRGDMVEAAVGDGSAFGLRVVYVHEGDHLRGTGGALRLCLDQGVLADWFLVLYGDSYLPIDLAPVVASFQAQGAPALMTVLRNDNRWDRSNVIYEAGRVQLYDKALVDPRMHHIDYGLAVLTRAVIAGLPPGQVSDLAHLYRDLSRGGLLAGHEVSQRFYEIGSPDGLKDLEARLAEAAGARPATQENT
jgi:MurNAc alpha-1-phosphate uridylyltransferase